MELDLTKLGQSELLPPYYALLAVDMENFSATRARHQEAIGALIPEVLETALTDSGMKQIWDEKRFARHGGDGYVFGTAPENLPFLISPFLGKLQERLAENHPRLAALDRTLRMRLRVSIDIGPLPFHGDGDPRNAMGTTMIDIHRRLDSDQVREALKLSDPDTTLVAAIISQRVYKDAVVSGYASIGQAQWQKVNATVDAKGYEAESYLYLPVHSWKPGEDEEGDGTGRTEGTGGGSGGGGPADPSGKPTPSGPGSTFSVGTNNGDMAQVETVHGDLNFGGGRR
ncbi:hypothetical protein NE857_13310 [Nocardiopsis exhalans]|uniref:Guanylate cyclase domain-containing protein n=1 Tax=Nocardiopsis exhalans TaxID=163604 RepID=A0ABY5DH66_9ACTN|nr:hypothetical protein [Nocardiopsis exhalans]USY22497.1 hypothetical protein NE857_13310 [Nocardiopsis exhalans]